MTYAVELAAEGPEDWTEWSAALAVRISGLAHGEDVVVSIPSLARPHLVRKSRFLGIIPAVHEDTWPWVRVRRDDEHAVAELVGSETFGGELLMSPDDEARIDGLGWRRPGHDDIEARVWSRWFPDDIAVAGYLQASDAAAAATLVTRTLREVFTTDF